MLFTLRYITNHVTKSEVFKEVHYEHKQFSDSNGRQHQSKKGRIAATELSGMIKTVPRKESDRCT